MLFSGGLDSRLQQHLIKPDILLYVDMNTSYSKAEIHHLKTLPKELQEKIIVTRPLSLKDYERKEEVYIPFRNSYLVFHALQYGQHVYFGFNESDNAPDKDDEFLRLSTQLISHMVAGGLYRPPSWVNENFSLSAPFKKLSKTDMVREFLKAGGTESELRSIRTCYSNKHVSCGLCSPCSSQAVAYINNNVPTSGMYKDGDIDPDIVEFWYNEHKKIRPNSKVNQDFKDALEKLRQAHG